jgi:hypothetical protein
MLAAALHEYLTPSSNHAAVFASNTTDITPGRTIRSPGQGLRAPSPTAKFNLKIEEPNHLNGYI